MPLLLFSTFFYSSLMFSVIVLDLANPLTPKMRFLILPSYNNLVLDQDDNLYQTRLRILISCLLDNVWIFLGENSF